MQSLSPHCRRALAAPAAGSTSWHPDGRAPILSSRLRHQPGQPRYCEVILVEIISRSFRTLHLGSHPAKSAQRKTQGGSPT